MNGHVMDDDRKMPVVAVPKHTGNLGWLRVPAEADDPNDGTPSSSAWEDG
jgi:hypothetical protein